MEVEGGLRKTALITIQNNEVESGVMMENWCWAEMKSRAPLIAVGEDEDEEAEAEGEDKTLLTWWLYVMINWLNDQLNDWLIGGLKK